MSQMKKLIDHLLCESAPLHGNALAQTIWESIPGNLPRPMLLECQIVLKGGYAMAGVLTTTPEDTLRLLAPGKKAGGGEVMVDHYFDYDDVLTIAIGREIPRPSSLIRPA